MLRLIKYDKGNIFIFFVFFLICNLILGYLPFIKSGPVAGIYLCLFVYAAAGFISLGLNYVACYNVIHNNTGIFPNLAVDLKKVAAASLKGIFGPVISFLILAIPAAILGWLCMIAVKANVIFFVIFFILYIIWAVYFVVVLFGVWFLYIQNLKFKSWFDYKKGMRFIRKIGKSGGIWVLQNLLLNIILIIVAGLVILLFSIVTGAIVNQAMRENIAFVMSIRIISSVFSCLATVYYIDLTGQLFAELREKKILKPLNIKKAE